MESCYVRLNEKNIQKRPAVFAETLPIIKLSSQEIERMYAIFTKYYVNHNKEQFTADLLEKNHIIVLRDLQKKTIQGFSTLLCIDLKSYGINAVGIFSGDTVLEKDYWGNKALGIAFLKYLWIEKIKSPFRPVYWFLISKGYKTYLLMANNFSTHYPRYDKATPLRYKKILDKFYLQRFKKFYKTESGTIEFDSDSCCLKEKMAAIPPELLKNKKVQFFTKMNPGWNRGFELACIAKMTLLMPLQYFIKKTFLKKKSA